MSRGAEWSPSGAAQGAPPHLCENNGFKFLSGAHLAVARRCG